MADSCQSHDRRSNSTANSSHPVQSINAVSHWLPFQLSNCSDTKIRGHTDWIRDERHSLKHSRHISWSHWDCYYLDCFQYHNHHRIAQVGYLCRVAADPSWHNSFHKKVCRTTQSRLKRDTEWQVQASNTIDNLHFNGDYQVRRSLGCHYWW